MENQTIETTGDRDLLRATAEIETATFIDEVNRQTKPIELNPAPLTDYQRAIAAWIASFRSANTRTAYLRDMINFLEWVGSRGASLDQVRRPIVDLFVISQEADGLSPATVARRLAAIASFYEYAIEAGLPVADGTNPAARVRRPKVSQESPRLGLSRSEARSLLATAEAGLPRDEALVTLLLVQGFRVSEALGIRLEQITPERGVMRADVTRKGAIATKITLTPRTLKAVERARVGRVDGFVVTGADGVSALSQRTAHRIIGRLAKAAGIDHAISPHSLRHTFVTLALEDGVPLHKVQDSAGHKSPETTIRYNRARHSIENHAAHAVAALVS